MQNMALHRRKGFQPAAGFGEVIWAKLSEGSGTTISVEQRDYSTQTVTIGAATTWETSPLVGLDYAASATGGFISDLDEVEAWKDFDGTTDMTIFGRFSVNTSLSSGSGQALVSYGQAFGERYTFEINEFNTTTGNINLNFEFRTSSGNQVVASGTSDISAAVDTEYWIAVTCDLGTGQIEFYVDGTNIASPTTSTDTFETPPTNRRHMQFGCNGSGTDGDTVFRPFDGIGADIRIYDVVKTSGELTTIAADSY